MPRKLYLGLLILFGISFQGIIGTFADENIRESSSSLVRQRRVVSRVPGEDRVANIENHPYIVYIKLAGPRVFCTGAILSHRIIITGAMCAYYEKFQYRVISSSARSDQETVIHNVTEIRLHTNNIQRRASHGLALFTIDPPIVYSRYSNKIDLHEEPIIPGTLATVSGWGYNHGPDADPGTAHPTHLRSIQVPILSHRECVNRYRAFFPISEKEICTFHPLKYTWHSDPGAPLVINNRLAGIFLKRGPDSAIYNIEYPDVFALLQQEDYWRWIHTYV